MRPYGSAVLAVVLMLAAPAMPSWAQSTQPLAAAPPASTAATASRAQAQLAHDPASPPLAKSYPAQLEALIDPWRGILTLALTILVGLATIAQAVFAGWAIQGLQHARVSADAATATLEEARKTTERQLRPYMALQSFKLETLVVGKPVEATVTLVNSGQTPADKCRVEYNLVVGDANEIDFAFPDEPPDGSRATIGPGATVTIDLASDANLTTAQIRQLKAAEVDIFIFGAFYYDDGFGARRITPFRLYLAEPVDLGDPKLWRCREGNDAT